MATSLGRRSVISTYPAKLELLVHQNSRLPKLQPSRLRLRAGRQKRAICFSTCLPLDIHNNISSSHPRYTPNTYYKHHSRQPRTFFWSSNKDNDNEEQPPAEVLSEHDGSSGFIPASSFSSTRDVIFKQRDEDLSSQELALKRALQEHQILVHDNPEESSLIRTSLEHIRDCFEALEYWEESFPVEQELEAYANSALELAHCIFRQGKLYMRVGDVMHANEKYQKALEMFQMEHNGNNNNNNDVYYHADIGNVLVAMAGVHYQRQKADECLTVLEEAEPHFRKHGQSQSQSTTMNDDPHPDLVKCLDNQGMIYRLQEDFFSALEKFEEALAVVGHSDFEKRQSLQMHIADMLSALDDVDSAIHYYHKILKEDKDRRGQEDETELDAVIFHSIGVLYSQQRELELAEEMLTKALELKQRFGGETNPDVASTLNALGSVHGVLGNKRQALECFQQALMIERMHAEDENDPQILYILRNISVLKGEKVPKWDG